MITDASEAWKTIDYASELLSGMRGCSREHALFLIRRRAHYGSGSMDEVAAGIVARSRLT
jgi:AmiR/NasT family two-component response regulator